MATSVTCPSVVERLGGEHVHCHLHAGHTGRHQGHANGVWRFTWNESDALRQRESA